MHQGSSSPAKHALYGPAEWPAGARLLQQGDVPSLVYVLVRGIVKLTHVTPDGDEQIVDVKRPPAWIGAPFVLARAPLSVNVTTMTDCSLRWCTLPAFNELLAADPQQALEIQRHLCTEILALTDRVIALTLKSSGQRLRDFLSQFGPESSADSDVIRLPFKQADVAACINISPEHLSRLLKRMKKAELTDRHLTKIKPKADGHQCGVSTRDTESAERPASSETPAVPRSSRRQGR